MAKRDNSHYKVQRQGKLRDHNICQVNNLCSNEPPVR